MKSSIQLFGFAFLLLGNFTYNEVIEWKCCGINKNMRKYMNDNKDEEIDNIISLGQSDEYAKDLVVGKDDY